MKRYSFKAVLIILFILISNYSQAKTLAYLIGLNGQVAKYITDPSALTIDSLQIPKNKSIDRILGEDTVNNYLYVSHCIKLGPCKVGVYKLTTLEFMRELPLTSATSKIQLVIYPDGSKVIINYFLAGSDGYTTDIFDGITLQELQNINLKFGLYKVMFSAVDNNKMYSIISGDNAKVDLVDIKSFQILDSIDLSSIIRKKPDVFSSDIEHFSVGKILIYENVKTTKDQPTKLNYYTYDIVQRNKSAIINIGLRGNAIISPDGSKIIFDENKEIIAFKGGKNRIIGFKSLGRLHIYDLVSGNKLGTIDFQVSGRGKILGVTSRGNLLFYLSEGSSASEWNITILDIENYKVINSFSVPFKVESIVLFN